MKNEKVVVHEQTYLSGAPVINTKTLSIGDISITISHGMYKALCVALSEDAARDLSKMMQLHSKYKQKAKVVNGIVRDITEIFYDVDDDLAWRKDIGEIEQQKITDLLEANKKLLGFE